MREPVVIDTNVIISALISDARTRELIVLLDERFVTPSIVREEVERNIGVVEEKARMKPSAIRETLDTLFEHVDILEPTTESAALETARGSMGCANENDSVVLATAIALDGSVWTDDTDFGSVVAVPVYTTEDVLAAYEERV